MQLGPTLDFMRLVWELDHELHARSKQMETAVGVSGMQRLVVRLVGRSPGVSAGELAGLLHVHPSTLTGVLARLEERGYLHRTRDPQDGRRARLQLTEQGKSLNRSRAGTVEAAVADAIEAMPPEDIAAAGRVLRAIAQGLRDGAAADAPPRSRVAGRD
jgi:MarR family transcriptional regulator, organic hydroperoxide resistance regulator